jgi:hypothetical protein
MASNELSVCNIVPKHKREASNRDGNGHYLDSIREAL